MADLIRYNKRMYHPSQLVTLRREALSRQDSLAYAEISDLLGAQPDEDPYLYEMGLAERMAQEEARKTRHTPPPSKASDRKRDFLNSCGGINVYGLGRDTEEKMALILEYLPGIAKGKREITDYDPVEIGVLFKRAYEFYSSKLRK